MNFTLYEPLANVSYLTALVVWLLTLVVWIYPPHLWAVAWESWRQYNVEAGAVYIARFLPQGLFRFLIYLIGSLGGGLLALRLGAGYGVITLTSYGVILLQLLAFSAGIYLFLYLRSVAFKLWRYILFDSSASGLLTQDYFFQDWLRALALALLALLSFSPLSQEALVAVSISVLGLVQLLGWVQVMRRTRGSSTGYLYVFLYLCAHEVVPILYLFVAGTYLTRSPLLPNL